MSKSREELGGHRGQGPGGPGSGQDKVLITQRLHPRNRSFQGLYRRFQAREKPYSDQPPPALVDDALVIFDDARARAALKVLGDLAASTQVIFFTHHQHMIHLAGEAVSGQILHVQNLDEKMGRE